MGHWTTIALLLAAAAAATVPRPRGNQLRVETSAAGIEIKAVGVPLADVLDRISRETGMKVIYDGAPPRKPVSLSFTRRNSVELVNAVLQDSGLNYAVVLDESRTKVARLLVTTAPPPPRRRTAAADPVETADEPLEEPPAPGEAEEGAEATPPTPPTPRPEPTLLPTPVPPPTSPFTPQGPGPILFPFLGSTPPPEPPPG